LSRKRWLLAAVAVVVVVFVVPYVLLNTLSSG
jgi:hypothetical protein